MWALCRFAAEWKNPEDDRKEAVTQEQEPCSTSVSGVPVTTAQSAATQSSGPGL